MERPVSPVPACLGRPIRDTKRGDVLVEGQSLNVLVIDDTESHASLVSRVVAKAGHRVEAVESVEDALMKFENNDYDLVITDIFMAGMSGLVGIEKIRKLSSDTKIIAMSAGYSDMSSEDALKTARKIGADAILSKPFPLADLRETVARLLKNRRTGGNIPAQ